MAHLVKLELGSQASPVIYRFTDFSSDILITGSEDYVVTKTGHLKYAGTPYITNLDENNSLQEGMVVTSDTYGFASGTVIFERETSGVTYVKISPNSLSDAPTGDREVTFTLPGVTDLYSANSFLLNLGSISETSALNIGSFKLQLSGQNQTIISEILNNGHMHNKVTVKRAFINPISLALIDTFSLYSGHIQAMQIEDNDERSVINLSLANHWADFSRIAGRRSTSGSQNQFFPDDKGFDFITQSNL